MRCRQGVGLHAGLADEKHAAGIAVKAVLDDGDIDIDGVAVLQLAVARDAVTDHVIDRRADRFRKATVVERGRDGILHFSDVLVADVVELLGRDAGFDVLADHVEYVGRQSAGDPHFVLFFVSFDGYGHGFF